MINKTKYKTDDLISRMQSFGYTTETLEFMLLPLVTELRDPLGSMGNDAALACLSDKPRMRTTDIIVKIADTITSSNLFFAPIAVSIFLK